MADKNRQRDKIAAALMPLPEVKPWPSDVSGDMDRRISANMDWQRGYAAPVPGPYDVVNPVVQQNMTQDIDRNTTEMQLNRLLRARGGQ